MAGHIHVSVLVYALLPKTNVFSGRIVSLVMYAVMQSMLVAGLAVFIKAMVPNGVEEVLVLWYQHLI